LVQRLQFQFRSSVYCVCCCDLFVNMSFWAFSTEWRGVPSRGVATSPPPEPERELACTICGAKFRFDNELSRHVSRVHVNPLVRCTRCEATFTSVSNMQAHVDQIHNHRRVQCAFCLKTFSCRSNLKRHMKSTHEQNSKKFKCEECDREFNYAHHLKTHVKCAHLFVRYPCKFCSKDFSRRSYMLAHQRKVHNQHPDPSKKRKVVSKPATA